MPFSDRWKYDVFYATNRTVPNVAHYFLKLSVLTTGISLRDMPAPHVT
ncbi:hypothetical protein MK805_10180 [Shimazuella sp. AN120528]|nr:hypothetical protein [Shimazuella soli]MCH5585337.1 hypothetical protein [Shimazuella soli]